MESYIKLAWKLTCMLRPYRKSKPTVGFPKYKFNNNLLGGVTIFLVMSGVTRTQACIS